MQIYKTLAVWEIRKKCARLNIKLNLNGSVSNAKKSRPPEGKEPTTATKTKTKKQQQQELQLKCPRCLVPPPRYCPSHLAPNLRLLSSGAGVKWLPTDVHSSLQLCQVLFSKGVRWPLRADTLSPPPPSPHSITSRLALIWVSLVSLVIVSVGWLINGDGACLDRTGERMNFKSPLDPSSTHTHTHMPICMYEFNELFYWPLEVCLRDRQSLFCLAFSHTANRW